MEEGEIVKVMSVRGISTLPSFMSCHYIRGLVLLGNIRFLFDIHLDEKIHSAHQLPPVVNGFELFDWFCYHLIFDQSLL